MKTSGCCMDNSNNVTKPRCLKILIALVSWPVKVVYLEARPSTSKFLYTGTIRKNTNPKTNRKTNRKPEDNHWPKAIQHSHNARARSFTASPVALEPKGRRAYRPPLRLRSLQRWSPATGKKIQVRGSYAGQPLSDPVAMS